MATSYTSLLGLALPVTGELSGTWGDTVNNAITSLLDTAVAGTTTLSTDGDVTLTTTTGASNQARQAILLCSGARTALRTITAPAQSKIYTVINSTTGGYSVKLVGAGPTTGVTIVAGESALVAWNGSDFTKISNTGGSASFTNVTVSGTTTLSGLTASTALALDASKNVVSVTNTGTGNNVLSASPTLTGTIGGASMTLSSLTSGRVTYAGTSGLLQDSANLTFDGTTLTANALAITNGVTLSGGTANGVAYLNGSKVLTTGSALTFDGSNLSVGGYAIFTRATQGFTINPNYSAANTNADLSTSSLPISFSPAGSEQMRLTSTGLGIGTSSPAVKLTVRSPHAVATATTYTGGFLIHDEPNGIAPHLGAGVAYNGGDQLSWIQSNSASGVQTLALNPAGGQVRFGNSAMTLDTSGNLGLGVTPSAWGSGRKSLDVNNASFYSQTGNYNGVASNAYNNGSNWIYKTTAAAQLYEQGGGTHAWFTAPSGTAGAAISFTQAMTLDASGRLGIGTTSPSQLLHVSGNSPRIYLSDVSTGSPILDIGSGGGSFYIGSDNSTGSAFSTSAYARLLWGVGAYPMVFATNNTERARIDSSGNLLVGTTSVTNSPDQGVQLANNSSIGGVFVGHVNGTATGNYYATFSYNAGIIGSITQSGTAAVLYNVTSDQRLKENIVDAPEFGSVIDSMRVRSYDWKADGNHQRAGFIAQELVTVAPEAVHQPADPEEMMAVDYSKLVPMLVKEIQSLRARVAQLESK